jgi:hypothetical protein
LLRYFEAPGCSVGIFYRFTQALYTINFIAARST